MKTNVTSKTNTFKNLKKLNTAQGSCLTNFGKNSIIPCSHSNNGTEKTFN